MKKLLSFKPALVLSLLMALFFNAITTPPLTYAQSPEPPTATEGETGQAQPEASAVILGENTAGPQVDFGVIPLGGSGCTPAPGRWLLRASLPEAVYGNAVVSDGTYIYSLGGFSSTAGLSDQFMRFDPQTNQWIDIPSAPTLVYAGLAVFAEGKIFLFGGVDASAPISLVQIYTIATGTWSSGANMPAPRQQMGGGYYNGKIYIAGGFETAVVDSASNQTWEYTPSSNSWATKATMPAALAGPGSGIIGGALYLAGGLDSAGTSLNTAYRYDIASDAWASIAALPNAVNYPGSAVYGQRLWIFGGGDPFLNGETGVENGTESLSFTQIYNPHTNSWSSGPSQNLGRSFQNGAVVRNQIFSIGGYPGGMWSSNIVESATQNPLKILMIYADTRPPSVLQFLLMSQPGVGQVDVISANSSVVGAGTMMAYDVVVIFSNTVFSNGAAQGDQIADYIDMGGAVVAFNFSFSSGYQLAGRWITDGYTPFNLSTGNAFSDVSLGSYVTGHPLMAGVNSLNAYYHTNVLLAPGSGLVATWSDGTLAMAVNGQAVGVNAYVGESPKNWSGDFAALIANAGYWLRDGNGFCIHQACTTPEAITGALTDSDYTQTGRLIRDDPASTCAASTSCPGPYNSTETHYDSYAFMNNTPATQCVTITLDPKGCVDTQYLQSAAYNGFLSNDLCANYIADIGSSPSIKKSYSFVATPWQIFTVTINEATANSFCAEYTLSVSVEDCPIKKIQLPLIVR